MLDVVPTGCVTACNAGILWPELAEIIVKRCTLCIECLQFIFCI